MIIARVLAYDAASDRIVRTYSVVADDEQECLDSVASDRSACASWRFKVDQVRRTAEWQSPGIDAWVDAAPGQAPRPPSS